jgi:hypothetical protein
MTPSVRPPPFHTTSVIEERDIYHILSDERRRVTIQVLQDTESPIDIETLADLVSDREVELSAGDAPGDLQRRVHCALYHNVLPLLASRDVIEWTRGQRLIELTDVFTVLAAHLNASSDLVPASEPPARWDSYRSEKTSNGNRPTEPTE